MLGLVTCGGNCLITMMGHTIIPMLVGVVSVRALFSIIRALLSHRRAATLADFCHNTCHARRTVSPSEPPSPAAVPRVRTLCRLPLQRTVSK